jgi:hypothetical protein
LEVSLALDQISGTEDTKEQAARALASLTLNEVGIISQANFILNVMTIETFDEMSDKFMNVGLDTPDLMKIGVDLIVNKAQLEEHVSFMYADLCKKITDQW